MRGIMRVRIFSLLLWGQYYNWHSVGALAGLYTLHNDHKHSPHAGRDSQAMGRTLYTVQGHQLSAIIQYSKQQTMERNIKVNKICRTNMGHLHLSQFTKNKFTWICKIGYGQSPENIQFFLETTRTFQKLPPFFFLQFILYFLVFYAQNGWYILFQN